MKAREEVHGVGIVHSWPSWRLLCGADEGSIQVMCGCTVQSVRAPKQLAVTGPKCSLKAYNDV
jgi:hypothetical protein